MGGHRRSRVWAAAIACVHVFAATGCKEANDEHDDDGQGVSGASAAQAAGATGGAGAGAGASGAGSGTRDVAGAAGTGAVAGDGGSGTEAEPDPFAEGTFAADHMAEISYDCEQAVACAIASDGSRSAGTEADQVSMCMAETAKILNASEARQSDYTTRLAPCAELLGCDYIDCVAGQVAPFGEQERASVERFCDAAVECEMLRGTFGGDPAEGRASCIDRRTVELNTYSGQMQLDYAERLASCAEREGCELLDCMGG